MKKKIKVISLLIVLVFLFSNHSLPVQAAPETVKPNLKVSKIKLNKKTFKRGQKLVMKVNFKTSLKLRHVKVHYRGPNANQMEIELKAANKSKTKWKGSAKLKQDMINGTWGIAHISGYAKYKKHMIDYEISNNRWQIEVAPGDEDIYKKRMNLSAGNIKIKK